MDWHPDPAETVLYRTYGRFASGFAAPVRGLRSFRDFNRRDIRQELPGWPPDIPAFAPHTKKAQATAGRTEYTFQIVKLLIGMAIEWFGGNTYSGGPDPSDGENKPQEPQDEVEDFPVIWAAPGTIARTLPWQLDPIRRPRRLETDLVLTDRRLLILGYGQHPKAPADVLWQTARQTIATAERRDYSASRADLKVTFLDGSWTRLSTLTASDTTMLVNHLLGTARLLTEDDLSEGQRDRVHTFMAGLPARAEPPTLTALPSGLVHVASRVPGRKWSFTVSETPEIVMGPDGKPTPPRPGDLF